MVLFIYIIQKGPFIMQYNKFESFFYENNIFYLEDNLTNDGKLPISFNRDALFCPECKSARLKFTSATSQKNAFLSTWPGDTHTPNCDYGFESASKKEICEYYMTLTDDQIQDKLEACMNHFFRLNTTAAHLESDNKIEDNPIILVNHETKKHKRLLTRSLKSVVMRDDDMLDTPILFYGKVKLEIKKAGHVHSIILKNIKSNKPFLYLKNGLLDYAPQNINTDYIYNFVFLGVYQSNNKYPELYRRRTFKYSKTNI